MAASPSRDLEEYWNEFHTIAQQESERHSDEDELSKTPDEGEIEAVWLARAGYGFVVNKFQDGSDVSDSEVDHLTRSLTRAQAEAVRKRINVLSTTLRKKNRVHKVHVKDIFPNQDQVDRMTETQVLLLESPTRKQSNRYSNEQRLSTGSTSSHKGGYSMSGGTNEITDNVQLGVETLGIHPRTPSVKNTSDPFSHLPSVSDIEISLDFHLEEANKATTPTSTVPDPHRVDLPAFEPKPDPLGVTLIRDLQEYDMEKIKALAHIELTTLFDAYNIEYSRPKRKKKMKDTGIFGVPLDVLVEQDQRRSPGTKVPLVFQAMVNFLEKEGVTSEGILRVSGADTRAKQLRQDLEEKFYVGLFSWGDASPHDVAVVFKQFLRELPIPLLSYDYLDAFPQVSSIPKTLEQLKALNLLILLLTEEHRNTLKVLLRFLRTVISHSNRNLMGLNNVAMIMAPNLFLAPKQGSKEKMDLEIELKKAAGTSSIVKMLIHYQDVLWTVPSAFIAQLRHQYTTDMHRKSKEKLRLPWKKDKDRSEIYKKPAPSPDQPEVQEGVIRVHAPHLTKSSALIQLDQFMTAADVVAKFKCGELDSPKLRKEGSTIGQMEETNGHTFRNPNNAQYAHDCDYLYEVGGNIGERCLDPRTKMMALYHVNPTAEWVIRTNKDR